MTELRCRLLQPRMLPAFFLFAQCQAAWQRFAERAELVLEAKDTMETHIGYVDMASCVSDVPGECFFIFVI